MKLILTLTWLIFLIGPPLLSTAQNCAIDAVEADVSPCDNGQFFATINFLHENTSNEGFSVTGNGHEYGSFAYGELPVEIGPLEGDGNTPYEFVIKDLGDPLCTDFVIVGVVDCPPPCVIEGLVVDPGECTSSTTYSVVINFEAVGFTSFDLFVNGEFHSFHQTSELPLHINEFPAGGNGVDLLKICANDNPECCKTTEIIAPDCGALCEISNLVASPLPCDGDQFSVELNFEFANNVSDFFTVHGNGKNYGEFPYSQLPIILGPFPGDGQIPLEFLVKDAENPECQSFTELDAISCGCSVNELVVDPGTCTSDSTYAAFINFNAHGFAAFDLYVDGSFFHSYQVAQLPLQLENLPFNSSNVAVITICANDNPECCQSKEYPVPFCQPGCDFSNLEMIRSDCDGNLFNVTLNFEYGAGTSETFEVLGNGQHYGTFPYSQLPITIGPLEGNGQTHYEFVVKDSEHPDCQIAGELGTVFCGCEIGEMIIQTGDCISEGTYQLELNFESVGFESFNVFANGKLIGSWDVADLPILINEFPASGHATDALKVCARNADACCRSSQVIAPDCAVLGCEIFDLHAAPLPCEGQDFYVEINFQTEGSHSETFTVKGNGHEYGTFAYNELPVVVGPLPGDGQTVYEFIIADSERDGCVAETVVEPVFCGCEIGQIEYNSGDCTSDSTYRVTINFASVGFESFDIYVNDQFLKHAEIGQLPLTLEHFPASGQPFDVLTVCANDRNDCCASVEIAAPDCVIPHCEIFDLVAHPTACDSVHFYVELDFEHTGPNSGHFQVQGNGVQYGTFAYADLPVKIGPLLGDGHTFEFGVSDLQFEDCGAFTVIDGVFCGCEIGELRIETGECTSDTTYVLALDFESVGVESFDVYANGHYLKHALITDLPLIIERFPASGNPYDVVKVCANDKDNCCSIAEVAAPDCVQLPCEILALEAAATDCDDSNQYYVKINFDPAGTH
ncbi:MAG: hypothetical protein OEQ53_08255, partial [Saprospiraceae bacterium]|nr:hypothetical protein [Saprospiraceae bacterium]